MSTRTISIQASTHSIKSVTVFKSSRAEVVRTFPLNLQKGTNKLEIKGLPSNIYAVRTSGLGNVARVDDFLCTVGRDKSAIYDKECSSEIVRALTRKKESLEKERTLRGQELELLGKYSQSLTGEHVSPLELTKFLHTFVDQSRNIIQARDELDEKIIQVGREIDNERMNARKGETMSKIDAVITSQEDTSVVLTVTYIAKDCSWDAAYELRTTTEDGKPSTSVALHYLATVKQHTGEDWTNAALTLSTNQTDMLPKTLPRIGRFQIRQGPPRPLFGPSKGGFMAFSAPGQSNNNNAGFSNNQQQQQVPTGPSIFGPATNAPSQGLFGSGGFGSSGALFGAANPGTAGAFGAFAGSLAPSTFSAQPSGLGAAPSVPTQTLPSTQPSAAFGAGVPEQGAQPSVEEFEEVLYEEDPPSESSSQPTVVVKETPLSMNFAVSETANIPSDGLGHQVTLAIIPFQVKVSHITIPRVDPRIYLQCDVKNTSEYKLLQGPVSVIIDDSYMSTTSLASDINPGDNFVCLLGNDPATKVVYTRTSKTVRLDGGAFAEDHNITTYTHRVSVYNKHSFDIADLVVYDSIPTAQDGRFKCILRKPQGLAEAKEKTVLDVAGSQGLKVRWADPAGGNGGREEGNFCWMWKVPGGETVTMVAEYEIKVPRGVEWVINHVSGAA